MNPQDAIEKHFTRLRPDQKTALRKLGLKTVRDLLYHFPARYEAGGPAGTVAGIALGAHVTLYGTIRKPEAKKSWKSKRPMAEAWFEDSSGRIKLRWFSQPYIAKMYQDGMVVKLSGKVTGSVGKLYIANPEIDTGSAATEALHENLFAAGNLPNADELYAIYPESRGISSLWFTHAVKKIIAAGVHEVLPDIVPEKLRADYSLPKAATAFIWMHLPKNQKDADVAKKRFAFEEVFAIQLAVQKARAAERRAAAPALSVDRPVVDEFIADFPFKPTSAQTRAIDAILDDFENPHPMMRLIEGDVGSGKTAVAAAAAYAVAHARDKGGAARHLQVAYMVPTEILAKQHFASFIEFFKKHHLSIGLITGKECYKFPSKVRSEMATRISRAQLSKWVANGEIPLVIGTHALIQKGVVFRDLALAIIDEQHRFGKVQRHKLARKDAKEPHLLSMTATPIPRTLALSIYGDLDLTVLDEMPAGRKPVITEVVTEATREKAYERMRAELKAGRQAYVICPRIDEPDPTKEFALLAKSAKLEQERLKKHVFPEYEIGLLHSKMTPAAKEEEMDRFKKNELQILVATSVVEVGVNVPNATVILIEGAERFGLAQLHQLRGRVIRSTHQAYCFLLSESKSDGTVQRLKALTTAANGFELAEADLALRGSGELYGARQWGVSDIAMEAIKNIKMVEAAREAAQAIIKADPTLAKHPLLEERIKIISESLYGE
ncbi:MAG: ATP-dependent DNA helicase RecG [Parcubacteria bacterium C7867-001]|nr:MAG: ATP-dependent DNA helicase RecG [Parcubacteria bacterium C7867-001]